MRKRRFDRSGQAIDAEPGRTVMVKAGGPSPACTAIAEALWLSPKTVETHVRTIFRKLDPPSTPTENRRVHAVLTFLHRDR
jgi:hypothetical protein